MTMNKVDPKLPVLCLAVFIIFCSVFSFVIFYLNGVLMFIAISSVKVPVPCVSVNVCSIYQCISA